MPGMRYAMRTQLHQIVEYFRKPRCLFDTFPDHVDRLTKATGEGLAWLHKDPARGPIKWQDFILSRILTWLSIRPCQFRIGPSMNADERACRRC